MSSRRLFLLQSTVLGLGGMLMPGELWARSKEESLVILHTNDWHSRIEPFPMDGSKFQGMGGAAKRASIIKQIRQEHEHVLLFDSGDIFQGTPYYNFFGGELEFKLMSEMAYDAATLGNHDFDGGMAGLVKQMPHATFPFVCSNYDVSNTELRGRTREYLIIERGPWKIGVLGMGVNLNGLVPDTHYEGLKYLNPIEQENKWGEYLKEEMGCNLLVCLSHLGYDYPDDKHSDISLASESKYVDIILGGHTHTFLNQPLVINNRYNRIVTINHAGWGGILLGRLNLIGTEKKSLYRHRTGFVKVS